MKGSGEELVEEDQQAEVAAKKATEAAEFAVEKLKGEGATLKAAVEHAKEVVAEAEAAKAKAAKEVAEAEAALGTE